VHDSFITFSAYEQKLNNTMKTVYNIVMQQQTDSKKLFKIPIKTTGI